MANKSETVHMTGMTKNPPLVSICLHNISDTFSKVWKDGESFGVSGRVWSMHQPAKLSYTGSNPVSRSKYFCDTKCKGRQC